MGLNFARALTSVGANIAAIDLADQPSQEFLSTSFGGKYKYCKANVTDYDHLKATIGQIHKDFGGIDGW